MIFGRYGVTEVTGVECEKIMRNILSNNDISININMFWDYLGRSGGDLG